VTDHAHKPGCDGHIRCPVCCPGETVVCVQVVMRDKLSRPVAVVCLECGACFDVTRKELTP